MRNVTLRSLILFERGDKGAPLTMSLELCEGHNNFEDGEDAELFFVIGTFTSQIPERKTVMSLTSDKKMYKQQALELS